ncbi:MAG: esterase [Flavipsychrobacter sp.]|jgi:YbgC/YbaW family acyl-CoA thioester hydrolase|nr:esterase [Flavipsychrobacter sp.]
MSRVKIKFPNEKPLFVTMIPVRVGDINYGGHLGNDAVLSVMQEARMQMLRNWGYQDELDAGGNALIMADVMIAYRGEAFYGDILSISIYVEELSVKSFNLLYHISTAAGKEIAHAKTGMACFDYNIRKIANLTEELKNRLSGIGI